MPEETYNIIALAMRYPFIMLIALMLIVLIFVSVSEFRARKQVMGQVGKYIGCIEVEDMGESVRVGVAAENMIGSSTKADIIVEDESVAKSHAMLYLKEGRVMLLPLAGATRINGRRASRVHEVFSGDVLSFGEVDCKLILKGAENDGERMNAGEADEE